MRRVFYGGFSVCLIAILAVAVSHPQNNLIPGKIFLYALVWVLILCGMKALLSLLERGLVKKGLNVEKLSRTGLIFYLIFYGIALYIVSLILRSYPMTDYGNVYQTAYSLATGQAVEDWSYFSMWTNNLGILSILAFCMRVGVLLGFPDPYYFVLALNVLQMVAVMLSIFYLAGKIGTGKNLEENDIEGSGSRRVCVQWFSILVFTLWTPVWASTGSFYSDQLSFGGSIIAMALFLFGCGLQRKKKWFVLAAAGIVWGIGIVAKATAAVGVIALVITMLMAGKRGRQLWRELLVLGLFIVLSMGLLLEVSDHYPSKADEYRLETPTEYWIAMGLMGNGTYADNAYLIKECNYSQNVDKRREFCRRMIRENWKNMFDREHLVDKASVIFGEGSISPTSHMYPYEESLLWHFVYWEGDYYWQYSCLSTGFFYAVLFLTLAGTLFRMIKKEENDLVFMSYLTVFGLFLFLMLWEAQNKQLYNHIPWMTVTAVCGLESLRDCAIMAISRLRHNRAGSAERRCGHVGK